MAYQTRARTFDRFMTVVDSVQRIDPTDEAALDRLARDLTRVRPRTLAEAYVARVVLIGVANAQFDRGVRGEVQRLGGQAFLDRVRSDGRYSESIPGGRAATEEMKRFAAGVSARGASAAKHLDEDADAGPTGDSATGGAAELQARIREIAAPMLVHLQKMAGGTPPDQDDPSDDTTEAVEEAASAAVDAVAACLEMAQTQLDACTQDVDDNPSPFAAVNTAAKAACTSTYVAALADCTAMP